MNLINWEDGFALGIKEIDQQHKKLIDLSNKYFELLRQGKAYESLGEIFPELIAYGDYHFKTEEKYFDAFEYESSEEHKNEHKLFVNKIIEFKNAYAAGETEIGEDSGVLTVEFWKFLKVWLSNHIKVVDKEYKDLFQENGL